MRKLALLFGPTAALMLAATAHAEPATSIPGDGTYVVGVDIQPGTYRTAGPADGRYGCYWERAKNLDGTVDSIIANDYGKGATTVRISSSDVAFKTSGCSSWTLAAPAPAPAAPAPAPARPPSGSFGS
ncbi:hypothetical protein [Nocardia wallacei]|uniref:hypothetical protein n=1 Tax=Nocardia wallacei TaxID=480035 RepID=UPI0024572D25|nr:hypothetical protein [Nocardia wallacei]